MGGPFVWLLVVTLLISIVVPMAGGRNVLLGGYWLILVLAFWVVLLLENLFNAWLIPAAPWLMWILGGGLIGATLGFWTVAPVYGLGRYRQLIAAAPFALLLLMRLLSAGLR